MRTHARIGTHLSRQLTPFLVAGAFILVVIGALWTTQERAHRTAADDLVRDATSTRQTIASRLRADEDFLTLLAGVMSTGPLDQATFTARAGSYVQRHPELLNLFWADSNFVIRWVSPQEPNKDVVGLPLSLPEPDRASHLAHDTHRPTYTRPFEILQGRPAFEVYVPVYRDDRFLGVFAGVYSVKDLLPEGIPADLRSRYQLSVVEQSGHPIYELPLQRSPDAELTRSVTLDPPGYGVSLRLVGYRSGLRTPWIATGAALSVLAIGFAAWVARRRAADGLDAIVPLDERAAVTLSTRDWITPAACAAALIVALGGLLWAMHQQTVRDQISAAQRVADVTKESIESRLRGNQDFLLMLAGMRSNGTLDLRQFQEIGTRYASAHPELINFTWVDDQLVIRSATPLETNQEVIGLPISLPEPSHAVQSSRSSHLPVYTRPFEAIQGNPSFELWIPVFHDDKFIGLLAAVYSTQQLLEHVTPPGVDAQQQIQLRDDHDSIIAEVGPPGNLDPRLRVRDELPTLGNRISLQINGLDNTFFSPGVLAAAVVATGLALGMLISMTNLRREVVLRKRAQVQLQAANKNLEQVVATRTAELAQRYSELEAARSELEEIAYIDVLTGLANRRMLTRELQKRLSGSATADAPFVLVLIDLDRFKEVNDTFGHDAGDALLLAVAHRLRTCVADTDFLARMGGDEFAVLLADDRDRTDAERISTLIIERFAEPVPFEGDTIMTSPSIGMASYPRDGANQQQLLKAADVALYAAKEAGRNTWRWYDGTAGTPAAEPR